MNVDFLKRKPIPKLQKGFDILLDPQVVVDEKNIDTEDNNEEKQFSLIVDKRGAKEINRSDIIKRLHNFKYNKPIEESKEMIVIDEPKEEEPETKEEEPETKEEESETKEEEPETKEEESETK